MTEIRPIKLGDFDPLLKMMQDDGHYMAYPTHVTLRDGMFVGCMSVGAIPLVSLYMHTKNAKPRDSWRTVERAEELVRRIGAPAICFPCELDSPLRKLGVRLGYTETAPSLLCIKTL